MARRADSLYGFHCRFCIKVSNQFRRNDKLSTKGYGCKDGEPLPITSTQKLKELCRRPGRVLARSRNSLEAIASLSL